MKYVFVSGNHESPDVLQRLQELEQVIIIDDHERTVHGLRIAGVGDLSADDYSPQVVPLTDLADLAKAINQHYQAVLDPPDIFLVHNHRVAAAIEPNIFPVVLLVIIIDNPLILWKTLCMLMQELPAQLVYVDCKVKNQLLLV